MFNYFKSLIDANTPQRVCAYLALTAGISLCLGFFIMIFKSNNIGLATVTSGLVALATFSKIDREDQPQVKIEDNES